MPNVIQIFALVLAGGLLILSIVSLSRALWKRHKDKKGKEENDNGGV